jgi:pimeloyl-ACP methyl ester carboxylesterase
MKHKSFAMYFFFLFIKVSFAFVPWMGPSQYYNFPETFWENKNRRVAKRVAISLDATNFATESYENVEDRTDVVLFGLGDLRVDDHKGLQDALSQSSKVLPLVVFDPHHLQQTLSLSHMSDTARMLEAAWKDLQDTLHSQLGLELHIEIGSVQNALEKIATQFENVHVHVCDLDPVDNDIGYGTYSRLRDDPPPNLHVWTCHLREEPWNNLNNIGDSFPAYEQMYQRAFSVQHPIHTQSQTIPTERLVSCELFSKTIPSFQDIFNLISKANSDPNAREIPNESGTGLYGTHWGGLSASTVGEQEVMQAVRDYCIACGEDDEKWAHFEHFVSRPCLRNADSLEHATISWMMRGTEKASSIDSKIVSENLLRGELMTRYLAAPLWLGTISPRRLWYTAKQDMSTFFYESALRRMVEGREWHKILASIPKLDNDGLYYRYWRWHGFLCRYAHKNLRMDREKDKIGLLLVHGFGASSSQWKRTIDALEVSESSLEFDQVLAPDLLGFGHCEKPALTYTQYLWSGFVGDFVKDIAATKHNWSSFCVAGNSIGGYTSIAVAADDFAIGDGVISSFGSQGTKMCLGLVLFNTAGKIQTIDEILSMKSSGSKLLTVAQLTALDSLPPCNPSPRPISRVIGNAILTFLRLNIQGICQKVYPVNPNAVDQRLCNNILRDSLDPGAVNVMISGSKLPIPRTVNEMLAADVGSTSEYDSLHEGTFNGPVLVAQGILDPLNDAKSRAELLGSLRNNIIVTKIIGGHCPHDEVPKESVKALVDWAQQVVKTPILATTSSAKTLNE